MAHGTPNKATLKARKLDSVLARYGFGGVNRLPSLLADVKVCDICELPAHTTDMDLIDKDAYVLEDKLSKLLTVLDSNPSWVCWRCLERYQRFPAE